MTSPSSHTVTFKRTKADQALLKAVEQALQDSPDLNFSELCKQALGRWLVAHETSAAVLMLMDMQQQVVDLQRSLSQLETNVLQEDTGAIARLEAQVTALTARLEQVEQGSAVSVTGEAAGANNETGAIAPETLDLTEPEPEPDPLLSRLGRFLEDF